LTVTLNSVGSGGYSGYGVNGVVNPWIEPVYDVIVIDPTTPILLFDYYANNGSVLTIVGGSAVLWTQMGETIIRTPYVPILYFQNAIIFGGYVCGWSWQYTTGLVEVNGSYGPATQVTGPSCLPGGNNSGCKGWVGVFNYLSGQVNASCSSDLFDTYTFGSTQVAGSELDNVVIDFVNNNLYLFLLAQSGSTSQNSYIVVSIPLDLYTESPTIGFGYFITKLNIPTGTILYYIQPPNVNANIQSIALYQNTLYIPAQDSNGNNYIWIIPLSSLSSGSNSTTFPMTVGTVTEIYSSGGSTIPVLFLNHYIDNGNFVDELLVFFQASTYTYVYSFNLSTLTATQLTQLSNINFHAGPVYFGGILAWTEKTMITTISSGSTTGTVEVAETGVTALYNVAIYDRKEDAYEQTQQLSGLCDMKVAEPGYAVAFTCSSSGINYTVYQIVVDVMPVITNLAFNYGTLTGTVVNAANNNAPLPNITLYLVQPVGQSDDSTTATVIATTTTDSNGNFTFTINTPGNYIIRVVQSI